MSVLEGTGTPSFRSRTKYITPGLPECLAWTHWACSIFFRKYQIYCAYVWQLDADIPWTFGISEHMVIFDESVVLSAFAYDYRGADAQFHWHFHQKWEYNAPKILGKHKNFSKSTWTSFQNRKKGASVAKPVRWHEKLQSIIPLQWRGRSEKQHTSTMYL